MEPDIIMPFGKYKGKKISEIPYGYLVYMYDRKKFSGEFKLHVENTVPVLKHKKSTEKNSKSKNFS